MNNNLQYGHEIIQPNQGNAYAGFNRRVGGMGYSDAFQYPHEYQDRQLYSGWALADSMIRQGRIYSLYNFHHTHSECNGHAFQYGGSWVCNTCNQSGVNKPWWIIKVYRDGNAWCCVGEGFENLQESDNAAFGDTRDEAIKNYGDLMRAMETK